MKKIITVALLFIIIISILANLNSVCASNQIRVAAAGDEIIGGADEFITKGENELRTNGGMSTGNLYMTTRILYNILLAIGIIVAVAVGSVLGIKYMLGSVEEKADYKQSLVAYLISCVVIFGAFGIWRLIINVLEGV